MTGVGRLKRVQSGQTWNDFMIATGLDHRCVHAVVEVAVTRRGFHTVAGT